jgi:hypothetical protein
MKKSKHTCFYPKLPNSEDEGTMKDSNVINELLYLDLPSYDQETDVNIKKKIKKYRQMIFQNPIKSN